MEISKNIRNTWVDENNNNLSERNLKLISKSWSADEWNNYLDSTVGTETNLKEISMGTVETHLEKSVETIPFERPLPESVRSTILSATKKLTPKQQTIIKKLYWDGYSEREIASLLNISRSTVAQQKTNSLRKIRSLLESDPSTSAYLVGCPPIEATKTLTKDQQIQQIYKIDLKGRSF